MQPQPRIAFPAPTGQVRVSAVSANTAAPVIGGVMPANATWAQGSTYRRLDGTVVSAPMTPPPTVSTTEMNIQKKPSRSKLEGVKTVEALEHMSTMQTYIANVQSALVTLQTENSKIKERSLKSTKTTLEKYFVLNDLHGLTTAFTEWRDEFRRRKAQKEADAAQSRRSQDIGMYENRISDLDKRHREEVARLREDEKQLAASFNKKLDEERQRSTKNIVTQHKVTEEKQKELDEAQKKIRELQQKLGDAERVIATVREGIRDHPDTEAFTQNAVVPDESQLSEFLKEKLHELLRCSDPRYLGRSAYPTVAEISSKERLAYANQSVCAVGESCLHHSHGGSPTSAPGCHSVPQPNPQWGTRSLISLHKESRSTSISPKRGVPTNIPTVRPAESGQT